MKTFHWTSLGVASAMVSVLISTAVLVPAPGGTSVARANFDAPDAYAMARGFPATDMNPRRPGGADADFAGHEDYNDMDTAAGPDPAADVLAYDLDAVIDDAHPVPRVTLASVPGHLDDIREIDQRKAVFFKTVLPLVLQVNERITHDRQRLKALARDMRAGRALPAQDRLWLAVMAERYGTRRGDVDALLVRHDVVPPSLALAQAAIESAWGTSRFAREGNAMFGQWTFAEEHDGIVPKGRADGQGHRVRAFDTLYDSVMSYVTNLNRHRAYKEFRQLRAEMRAADRPFNGKRLAATLHHYSERGAAYVAELHAIMAANELSRLDGARLSDAGGIEPLI